MQIKSWRYGRNFREVIRPDKDGDRRKEDQVWHADDADNAAARGFGTGDAGEMGTCTAHPWLPPLSKTEAVIVPAPPTPVSWSPESGAGRLDLQQKSGRLVKGDHAACFCFRFCSACSGV